MENVTEIKAITRQPHDHPEFSNHDYFLMTNVSANIEEWWSFLDELTEEERDEICAIRNEQDRKFSLFVRKVEKDYKRGINKFCNHVLYSDVEPYEVVRVVSNKCVEIRSMDTKQTKFPSDFHAGGFCGHFADNHSGQAYEFISNPENPIIKVRWSERNQQWQKGTYRRFRMSDTPQKHYDYNF